MKSSVKTSEAVEVQLQTISPRNNIVVSKDGKPINPHLAVWDSKRISPQLPLAFDLGGTAPASLEVTLAVKGVLEKGALLQALASDNTVLFSGEITGDSKSIVQATSAPAQLARLNGNILHWQLTDADGDHILLGSTEIEIYWVNMKTVPVSLCRTGAPVEVLQQLSEILPLSSLFPADKTMANPNGNDNVFLNVSTVTVNVWSNTPPAYDIWFGAPYFITATNWDNITLHYSAYLAARSIPTSILNCYDTAAVLQHLLVLNGYTIRYCYMDQFGYLRQTVLIGRGLCNNPFYGATGGPAVIGQTNTARTAFGNHGFVYVSDSGCVADACAGPHTGTETPQEYVTAAIDNVYPLPPHPAPGTVANISYHDGVTSVDAIQSVYELPDFPHTETFMAATGLVKKDLAIFASKAVAGKWPAPASTLVLNNEWQPLYEELVPGAEETLKIWMLKNGNDIMMIKLYVSSGANDLAYNRFITLGALSQNTELPYEAGPVGLGHYNAVGINKQLNKSFWVFHNAVLDIMCTDTATDVAGLSAWYYEWATRHLTDHLEAQLPPTGLQYSSLKPRVGESLHVTHPSAGNILLDIVNPGDALRLISKEPASMVFDVLKPATTQLQFLVTDQDTLLVASETATITASE